MLTGEELHGLDFQWKQIEEQKLSNDYGVRFFLAQWLNL